MTCTTQVKNTKHYAKTGASKKVWERGQAGQASKAKTGGRESTGITTIKSCQDYSSEEVAFPFLFSVSGFSFPVSIFSFCFISVSCFSICPNFFRWIRSTTVMEAHFPRKAPITDGASSPKVVLLAVLIYHRPSQKYMYRLRKIRSSEHRAVCQ